MSYVWTSRVDFLSDLYSFIISSRLRARLRHSRRQPSLSRYAEGKENYTLHSTKIGDISGKQSKYDIHLIAFSYRIQQLAHR